MPHSDNLRVKQESISIEGFDLITIRFVDKNGKEASAMTFDRLIDDVPKITFGSPGVAVTCDS